ncbi:MAG: ATP-binding protein [Steroidobacteraceae bacterium]
MKSAHGANRLPSRSGTMAVSAVSALVPRYWLPISTALVCLATTIALLLAERARPPGGAPLSVAIAIAGLLVSILLPLNIAFAQAGNRRARESDSVKQQLEAQIRERQRSEEVTRENEERFRLAFGNAAIGMALLSSAGRWLHVNASLCRVLGYSEAELLATDFQTLTHPEDLCPDLPPMQQVLAGSIDSHSTDKRFIHKSGRIVNASLHISYVKEQPGRPGCFVAQIMDISERVEMDRLQSEFISILSHELRTPLTSIAGSLGLVSGGVAGELPPKATQLVGIAARNSARLVRLIDDILYIEKAAAGKLEFDLELQPLAPIVAQAIEANREYAHRFGARLVLAQSCPGVWVRVDRDRLIQVLTNLISNAAKSSPANAVVSVGTQEQGPQVRVWVKDDGPGIPESFRKRIFQPFAQAEGPEVRNKGGTGLGLSIAKAFMERLGGTVDYETIEGQGSTFFICLPIERLTSSASP